jgi:tetratricopeptide (TPR) repeat protein
MHTYKYVNLIEIFLLGYFLISDLHGQDYEQIQQNIINYQKSNDSLNLSRSWYNLGKYYYHQNNIENSNKALIAALFYAKSISNQKAISLISNYLATNFSDIGASDSALYYYKMAIDACNINDDQLLKAKILINYAHEFSSTGKYSEAAQYAIQSVKIKESLKDSTELAFVYQKLGEIYKAAGQNDKWEKYVNMAYRLKDCKKCSSPLAMFAIYNDLGGIAEKKGEYEQALLFYDTIISMGRKYDHNHAIGVAMNNKATIYKVRGNLQKALEVAIEAQQYENGDAYQKIYKNNQLAELYLAVNNLEKAKENVQLAITDITIKNYPEEKARAFKILYEIEKRHRNFKEALSWYENSEELFDSLRDKDIRKRIEEMEIAYQTEKKEQQITILKTENSLKSQRVLLFITISAVLILLMIIGAMFYYRHKKQNLLEKETLKQQLLRSQMNPHFLFNALGSIQNYMLRNETPKAAGYLSNFASLTRSILEHSAEEYIPLTEEISMLHNYIKLEQMRLQNSFGYEIQYNEDLETEFIHIPPMLIQPFVENAIKHGLQNLNYRGLLRVIIEDHTETLNVHVIDNGTGYQKQKPSGKIHKSMALTIFEQRRKVLRSNIGLNIKDYAVVEEGKTGTFVEINIPIKV